MGLEHRYSFSPGRPHLNVMIADVEERDGRWDFYERHKRQRLSRAPTYADYESLNSGGAGQYIYMEYYLQPRARDCRYHVVEHAYPSWNAPGEYGFIISAGICEADLPAYQRQREAILDSFNELR